MTGTYEIIYADPPWRYSAKKVQGAAENHYPTMSIDELCALPVAELAAKDSALFKEQRFKRQHGVLHQRTPVERLKYFFHRAVIHSRKLQKVFHQPAHLVGHGEDALGKAGAGRGVVAWRLQQLRIRQDDGQGRFQLMRGVRHELPLLVPRPGNGPHQPACQQQAHDKEHRKSRRARNGKRADEAVQRCRLGRGVGKNDAPASSRMNTLSVNVI